METGCPFKVRIKAVPLNLHEVSRKWERKKMIKSKFLYFTCLKLTPLIKMNNSGRKIAAKINVTFSNQSKIWDWRDFVTGFRTFLSGDPVPRDDIATGSQNSQSKKPTGSRDPKTNSHRKMPTQRKTQYSAILISPIKPDSQI